MSNWSLLYVVLLLILSGCAATRTFIDPEREIQEASFPADSVAYEVFLLGNTGASDVDAAVPVLNALAPFLEEATEESAVVFLGDQLPNGLPDSAAVNRGEADARLRLIAESVQNFAGQVFVVPGDRDWNGPESVRRQEAMLEELLRRDDVFIPGDARPGPVVLELTDTLVLIGLDTAWWLEDDPKPIGDAGDVGEDEGKYEIANSGDIIFSVEDALTEYDDENVLIVGHHPFRSNGPHGGQFTLGRHLLPAPILGSVYPLFRQFAGTSQDLAHPEYRAYRTALDDILLHRDRVVYASSHEHSLQAFPFDENVRYSQHYLISGSAARSEPVAAGRGASVAASDRGFMRLRYLTDGSVHFDVYSVDLDSESASSFYSDRLYGAMSERVDAEIPDVDPNTLPSYADFTVTEAINPDYAMGSARQTLLGSGYREAWTTPVDFPVLDMSIHGGLEPLQKGGGMQTLSLRLRGGDGHEYVLRLARKRPGRILPPELSESLGADILDDLASATLPWGAVAVADLAESAGIYHTNPRIVYIPDDPRLGIYREEFANKIALFEERPDEDWSEADNFGNSEDVISSAKMFEEVTDDNDHCVDQRFYLKSRLFDMLISDWDRHPDQWRWASFEPYELDPTLEGEDRTQGKIYRPIPRDRDFAFYRLGGFLPWVARQVEPKLQPFRESYGSLSGLTTSGIPLDRRFTTALTLDDWIEIGTELRDSITDEEINEAIALWPPEIFAQYGEETIRILRVRREKLPEVAEKVFELLSHAVDVAGSNKHERFEVTGYQDGTVEVVILKTTKEGEIRKELYRRIFYPGQTAEIRLYGLGGNDQFVISGTDHSTINVRMIGGSGEDRVENPVRGSTTYYDTIEGNDVSEAGRSNVVLSDDPENNRYEPENYRYPHTIPGIMPGYGSTDGVIIGASLTFHRPGFRSHPWAFTHHFNAAFATSTDGVRGQYIGRLYDAFGEEWDAVFDLNGSTVSYVNNFYGLGNETMPASASSSYHHVGLGDLETTFSVIKRVEQSIEFRFGGGGAYHNVEEDSTRFVGTPAAELTPSDFDGSFFARGFATLTLNATDNAVNPKRGFRWTTRTSLHGGLGESAPTFASAGSDLSLYASLSTERQLTVAGRVGMGRNFGTFPFYLAQSLGGSTNLRGLRRERYSGRTAAYQNVEVRGEVIPTVSRTFPLTVGVLGFVDNGRVWADGESSSVWHQAYGGGVWVSVLDLYLMQASLAQGDDGLQFSFGLNFFY